MNANPAKPKAGVLVWIGRVITTLAALPLLAGGIVSVMKVPAAVKGSTDLGYPENVIPGIGVAVIVCVVLYLIPRTTVLGAMLLTAYLGGAVATHVRAGQGPDKFMAAVVFAVIVWLGPWLRDARLRQLAPWRRY